MYQRLNFGLLNVKKMSKTSVFNSSSLEEAVEVSQCGWRAFGPVLLSCYWVGQLHKIQHELFEWDEYFENKNVFCQTDETDWRNVSVHNFYLLIIVIIIKYFNYISILNSKLSRVKTFSFQTSFRHGPDSRRNTRLFQAHLDFYNKFMLQQPTYDLSYIQYVRV